MKYKKPCIYCNRDFLGDGRTKLCSKECKENHTVKSYKDKHKIIYYLNHEESKRKQREKSKIFREKNPIYVKNKNKESYYKHRDKRIEGHKAYRKDNIESIRATQKIWREKNKDYIRKKNKERWMTEKGHLEHRINRQKRRLLESTTNDNTINKNSIYELIINQSSLCNICKVDISNKYHIDHIIPLSKGGIHSINNIQILCPQCNLKKRCNIYP